MTSSRISIRASDSFWAGTVSADIFLAWKANRWQGERKREQVDFKCRVEMYCAHHEDLIRNQRTLRKEIERSKTTKEKRNRWEWRLGPTAAKNNFPAKSNFECCTPATNTVHPTREIQTFCHYLRWKPTVSVSFSGFYGLRYKSKCFSSLTTLDTGWQAGLFSVLGRQVFESAAFSVQLSRVAGASGTLLSAPKLRVISSLLASAEEFRRSRSFRIIINLIKDCNCDASKLTICRYP